MSASAAVRPAPGARYLLLATTLLLAIGGLLMIWSASSAADFVQKHDSYYHVSRQAVFLLLGIATMLVASRTSASFVRRLGWWVLGLSDLGLALVLLMGVGKFGATRWLDLGFTTLQPSEFARLGCVLVVAEVLADRARRPRPFKEDVPKLALVVGVPFALVMAQPDMGTAMSILLAVFFVLVLGGLSIRYVLGTAAAIGAAVPILIAAASYRASRLAAFLDPYADPQGKGFQIIQASLAFGSGGLTGVGLGLSRQKFFYLPAAHTDFILAIIGEELGLAGTLVVVGAFGLLCYAGVRIALSLKDTYARLVAGGVTIMIVTQAVINMASVTGLMPITGIPLPLVSYGGSSLVFTLGCIGLILAMTRGRDRAVGRVRPPVFDTEGTASARTGERRRDGRPHLSGIDGGRARQKRRA
jgi:cell division protein FtsW